jgi:hypothetical protein
MQDQYCKNCEAEGVENGRFCHICGQSLHIHRFTIAHFLHEMFHAFTHADKGILLLIKDLAKKPGMVMYDYIVAGKRKTYFNPFIFIVLTGGFLLFSNVFFKPYNTEPKPQYQTENNASFKDSKISGKDNLPSERGKKLNYFFEKNSKIIMIGSVPVSALVFFMFFKKRGIYYAEHLVAMCLLTGSTALLMAIVMIPFLALLKKTPYTWVPTVLLLAFQLFYFGWAYHQFFSRMGKISTWKPYLVSAVNIIFWSILSAGAGFLYIFWPAIYKA